MFCDFIKLQDIGIYNSFTFFQKNASFDQTPDDDSDDVPDDDEVFLYDDHIPSIPSLPTRYYENDYSGMVRRPTGPMGTVHQRRNRLLKMISDPKCYNPRVLKSLSQDQKRRRSQDVGIPQSGSESRVNGVLEKERKNGYQEGTSV